MSRNGKVVVAMSGGVDSSVAAAILRDQGYECIGVFLRVGVEHPEPVSACAAGDRPARRAFKHGCCSANDAQDARAVAGRLGIPFYALNFQDEFQHIIDYFVDEYAAARTPNPCVQCNIQVKFGKLMQYADLVEAEFVATGHYARILRRDGNVRLARSLNHAKDQSYVLFGIRRSDLSRCLFPVGNVSDKRLVRSVAADLGLMVHDKPDSQEICFVPDGDYAALVRARRPDAVQPGLIRDAAGLALAPHNGLLHFTIGQRRGLGFAGGRPLYVTRLDVLTNTVTVDDRSGLLASGLIADRLNWLSDAPVGPTPCSIKIRHMHDAAPGRISCLDAPAGAVRVDFHVPQTAVTPGQAAVFYEDDLLLGGGWILRALEAPQPSHAGDDLRI